MESRPYGAGRVTYGLRAPAPRFHSLPILSITSASWYDLVVLNSRCYGLEVYYDGERNQPVTDQQRADPEVYQSLGRLKWQGWLAVRPYRSSKIYLVSITPVTVACVPQLDDEAFDLRGWCIGLHRKDGAKRGKVMGRWNNERARLESLPHPPDIADVLEKMWSAPLKRLAKDHSAPPPASTAVARQLIRDVADSLTIPT